MLQILYTYLIQRKSLFLPGVGHFRLLSGAARYDAVHQQLFPPVPEIQMTDEQPPTQKELFDYIARKLNISELEAIQQFNTCLFEMRQQLKSGKAIDWQGVGVLSAGNSISETILIPYHYSGSALGPVEANRIIRKDRQYAMLVGDQETDTGEMQERLFGETERKPLHWGWYALILAVIGLLFLGYHIFNLSSGSFSGSRQLIFP